MIDFTSLRKKETTMDELCGNLSLDDLRSLTNEMVDTILNMISECIDDDVTFVPQDLDALDRAAATDAELNMAWTLGHVIVHVTASSEEAAFLSAELARGVQREGRSRAEVYWETVTTLQQCRDRLEESRRMRLAMLEVWPAQPHLDNTATLSFLEGPLTPSSRFVAGLLHADSHLDQIADIVEQAVAARS